MNSSERGYIDVVEVRRVSEVVQLEDVFQLKKDRPLVWLQRICIWMLRRLGCQTSTEVVRFQRHVFGKNGQTFMTRLWQRKAAIWGSFDMEPKRLLIGSEDYAELMSEAISNNYFTFNAQYHKGRDEVLGLAVEVIPWMRGMLLLR